ncbi:hypothetical protein ACIQNU_41275 [Streptomyces sp. NPDC091292]|uniref:hypothetical protein n=1 Tax=Streptomyces sp. NPDC091292 TaxID=3365991 RepID=UPI00380C36FC
MAMAPRCCDTPTLTRLLALNRRGTPPGTPGHDVVFDYTDVLRCSACGGGVVEHHSHDCWDPADHASWDMYWWWRIDTAGMRLVEEWAAACPDPLSPTCDCSVHRGLGPATPPGLPPAVQTRHERADMPRTGVRLVDGLPQWDTATDGVTATDGDE